MKTKAKHFRAQETGFYKKQLARCRHCSRRHACSLPSTVPPPTTPTPRAPHQLVPRTRNTPTHTPPPSRHANTPNTPTHKPPPRHANTPTPKKLRASHARPHARQRHTRARAHERAHAQSPPWPRALSPHKQRLLLVSSPALLRSARQPRPRAAAVSHGLRLAVLQQPPESPRTATAVSTRPAPPPSAWRRPAAALGPRLRAVCWRPTACTPADSLTKHRSRWASAPSAPAQIDLRPPLPAWGSAPTSALVCSTNSTAAALPRPPSSSPSSVLRDRRPHPRPAAVAQLAATLVPREAPAPAPRRLLATALLLSCAFAEPCPNPTASALVIAASIRSLAILPLANRVRIPPLPLSSLLLPSAASPSFLSLLVSESLNPKSLPCRFPPYSCVLAPCFSHSVLRAAPPPPSSSRCTASSWICRAALYAQHGNPPPFRTLHSHSYMSHRPSPTTAPPPSHCVTFICVATRPLRPLPRAQRSSRPPSPSPSLLFFSPLALPPQLAPVFFFVCCASLQPTAARHASAWPRRRRRRRNECGGSGGI